MSTLIKWEIHSVSPKDVIRAMHYLEGVVGFPPPSRDGPRIFSIQLKEGFMRDRMVSWFGETDQPPVISVFPKGEGVSAAPFRFVLSLSGSLYLEGGSQAKYINAPRNINLSPRTQLEQMGDRLCLAIRVARNY